jgi:hypothetical protein
MTRNLEAPRIAHDIDFSLAVEMTQFIICFLDSGFRNLMVICDRNDILEKLLNTYVFIFF